MKILLPLCVLLAGLTYGCQATHAIYVADAFGRVHALDLATGAERPGWPVTVYTDFRRELVWGALTNVHGPLGVEAGPEMEAAYVLGAALSDQNRAEDALEAFRQARMLAGPDRLRAAIAAVIVGGTAISGGRGTLLGSHIGVALLGSIGPALVFLGIQPQWEKAIQGLVILLAVATDALDRGRR